MIQLDSKNDVDDFIRFNIDKVVCLRIGKELEQDTMVLDDTIGKSTELLKNMALFGSVDADTVPEYVNYCQVTIFPSLVFFFNTEHIKVDFGTADHSKWVGTFAHKQDLIDLVETIYRGAMKGHHIVTCPIPESRIPKYQLLYTED